MYRRTVLAGLGASVAGCLGGSDEQSRQTESPTAATRESTPTPGRSTTTPKLPTADKPLPLPKTPSELRDAALSGGPPKDGIPAIEDPKFTDPTGAPDGLAPGDPVFGVAMDGDVKAYPQQILVRHEICNDSLDGRPVSVTYCPLTGTPMGFLRGDTTFGVSGRLVNNNLIMYDRASETWWPQVLASSVPGPWNESPERRSLQEFRVVWTTWERWRETYPETKLLSRDTGFAKNYDSDPYGTYNPRSGYYERDASPMFRSFSADNRLQMKAAIIGARTPNGAVAFSKEHLREEQLVTGSLGGTPVLAVYDTELDTAWLYSNATERSFEYRDGEVVSDGNVFRPDSLPLDTLVAFDAMWFAWIGFYPETELYA